MRRLLISTLVLLVVGSAAWAEGKVLSGLPNYFDPASVVGAQDQVPAGPQSLGLVSLAPDQPRPAYGVNPLGGVSEYVWWYGCSPTSGGMMVGYWDGRPGYGNLYDGDASIWGGNGNSGTRSMVASTQHIVAGHENGYTYGDYRNSTSYPNHESNPNCIADFMHTVDGGSYSNYITSGLQGYCQWDNPATAVNESYQATATNIDVPYWQTGGNWNYDAFRAEIDANRTVLLNVLCSDGYDWLGHSIVGYGYQDDMFQVVVPTGADPLYLTVGGMAVMDTWANGTGFSNWVDWDFNVFSSVIDGNGVEWWPFIQIQGSSWVYTDGTPGPYDWMVSDAVTLDVIPEPATLSLLALGLSAALIRRRRGGK